MNCEPSKIYMPVKVEGLTDDQPDGTTVSAVCATGNKNGNFDLICLHSYWEISENGIVLTNDTASVYCGEKTG